MFQYEITVLSGPPKSPHKLTLLDLVASVLPEASSCLKPCPGSQGHTSFPEVACSKLVLFPWTCCGALNMQQNLCQQFSLPLHRHSPCRRRAVRQTSTRSLSQQQQQGQQQHQAPTEGANHIVQHTPSSIQRHCSSADRNLSWRPATWLSPSSSKAGLALWGLAAAAAGGNLAYMLALGILTNKMCKQTANAPWLSDRPTTLLKSSI